MPVPEVESIEREVWKFAAADWDRLEALLPEENRSSIFHICPDEGARLIPETLLGHARRCTPKKRIVEQKSTQPWLNEVVLRAVADKKDAEGTPPEKEKAVERSSIVLRAYNGWVSEVHKELASMRQGSKAWWKREGSYNCKSRSATVSQP